MGPRPRLMCLAGTAIALGLASPAVAQDAGFAGYGNMLIFTYEHAPPAAAGQTLRAGGNSPAQGQQTAPPPAPSGCPFRDGKLELIA